MTILIYILSWFFMLSGLFFCFMGIIGFYKLPDLFTKQHALGMIDTMGVLCISVSLALKSGFSITSFKVLLLGCLAIILSAPISNAFIKAAIINKIHPTFKKKKENKQ